LRPGVAAYEAGARVRLRRFRQASTLAVALTAILLLLGGVAEDMSGQEMSASQPEAAADAVPTDPAAALEQAGGTIRDLVLGFYAFLPKLALCLVVFGLAWMIARALHLGLRAVLGEWERTEAVSALS
jgi:hypothetical protein